MADIEEADGHEGAVREWLGRAARAPRDKAWVAEGVISDRWAPISPSGALDAFVWRTPDERFALPAEPPAPATAPPVVEAIAAPAPPPAPAPSPQVVEPQRHAAPAQSPAVVPTARTGVIVDPASMAPDDPGPDEPEAKRRGFRLYANE